MTKPTIYIETTILSYLVARPSRDAATLAAQQATSQWWENHRHAYSLYVSEELVREASAGDSVTARKRLELITGIPILEVGPIVLALAQVIIAKHGLPKKAQADAIHVACASINKIDVLLTWNMRHLVNPVTMPRLRGIITEAEYRLPEISTPQIMLEIRP